MKFCEKIQAVFPFQLAFFSHHWHYKKEAYQRMEENLWQENMKTKKN